MRPEHILGILASVVIVGAVIAGLLLIDGPGKARAERFDAERIQNMATLAQYVDEYYRLNEAVPASLSELEEKYEFDRNSTDPRSGETYPYEKLSDNHFRLCATFETEGPHEIFALWMRLPEFEQYQRHAEPNVAEGAGLQCFEISAVRDD